MDIFKASWPGFVYLCALLKSWELGLVLDISQSSNKYVFGLIWAEKVNFLEITNNLNIWSGGKCAHSMFVVVPVLDGGCYDMASPSKWFFL